MEPGNPDVVEQLPAGGNPNAPSSGTYGEEAALDRLKAALPNSNPDQPQRVAPRPMPSTPSPVPPPAPGLPPGMFTPTAQPQTPISTPLTEFGPQVPGSREEAIIQTLDLLTRSEDASETTKELARLILDRIIRS